MKCPSSSVVKYISMLFVMHKVPQRVAHVVNDIIIQHCKLWLFKYAQWSIHFYTMLGVIPIMLLHLLNPNNIRTSFIYVRAIFGQFLCTTPEAAEMAKKGQHCKSNDFSIISMKELI